MVIARQPLSWKWISVTKLSKYGKIEYSRALNASYTFQSLMSFCMYIKPHLCCDYPTMNKDSYNLLFNVQKVIKLLKAIDVGKATGLDKIPNRLLKIAADVVAPSLTGIFNQSLVTGIFPSDWKMAKVSPIFKNGSKSDLNNYRPICSSYRSQNFRKKLSMTNYINIWMKMVY